MEILFRIDEEGARIPIRPRWRARRQTSRGWVEFPVSVDFERARCRIASMTFDFQVVGTNLMRNVSGPGTDEPGAQEPFRSANDGRWTVLEVLVPGDRRASFLLAFDARRGQGMISAVPGEEPRVLRDVLARLFGSDDSDGLPSPQSEEPEYENTGVTVDPQHPPGFESGGRPDPTWFGTSGARRAPGSPVWTGHRG